LSMSHAALPAFEGKLRSITLSDVRLLQEFDPNIRKSSKYRRIRSSIKAIGLVEPLVVFPSKIEPGYWLLLDGRVRFDVIRGLNWHEAICLVASDDEGFTYNKRIARLPLIQEHYMITRALERGVSAEKIAKTLNININTVKSRKSLLDGICPQVVELLKHKTVSPAVFTALRPMKVARQLVAVDLMLNGGCLNASYARALREGTRDIDLKENYKARRRQRLSSDQIARIQKETELLEQEYRLVDETFGEEVLDLVVVCAYVAKLLRNEEIGRFLNIHYEEIGDTLRSVVAAASPEQDLAA
jgi:ParB-like chromosome segregation protein Spo0J